MRSALVGLLSVGLCSCVMNYHQPKAAPFVLEKPYPGDAASMLNAVRQLLVREGYQIASADEVSGTISTAPRDLRVTPEQADCGTFMGMDFLNDFHTKTRVALGVIVADGKLTVRANIEGESKSAEGDLTLTCLSRGVLETEFVDKLIAGMTKSSASDGA